MHDTTSVNLVDTMVKWNKLDTKGQILCDTTYGGAQSSQTHTERWLLGAGGGRNEELLDADMVLQD